METIIAIIVFIALFILIYTIYNNKFQFVIIEIEEAENNVEDLLHKKFDLLQRTIPIINKELKLDDFLEKIEHLDLNKISHFELNDLLRESYNTLLVTVDENDKLNKSEPLKEILDDLENLEIELSGAIKFYNDGVTKFNKLVATFPANIVSLLRGYKKKEFYSNEKKEMFEILNEE